jgi:hypothetical protein
MMFRRILPYALALAVAGPAAAMAATPAEPGAPALLQPADWPGEHDGDHGAPPPWLWNHDHDHDRDHHRRDHRGHWVPAHFEWHHHHRVWIPGHWDRT